MRIATSLLGLLLICASAAAEPATETLRFAIIRNGDQIGTHTIELKRSGQEIAVNIETEVLVKVLFVTAYRFQHAASERWVARREQVDRADGIGELGHRRYVERQGQVGVVVTGKVDVL